MPASVLEAFASGCAVVATNAGGVPAILSDGVHGLLVPATIPKRRRRGCAILSQTRRSPRD